MTAKLGRRVSESPDETAESPPTFLEQLLARRKLRRVLSGFDADARPCNRFSSGPAPIDRFLYGRRVLYDAGRSREALHRRPSPRRARARATITPGLYKEILAPVRSAGRGSREPGSRGAQVHAQLDRANVRKTQLFTVFFVGLAIVKLAIPRKRCAFHLHVKLGLHK